MNGNLHAHLTEAAAEAARVARGVRAGQLDGPTPCAEFDVRTLVNHWVLYTSHGLERRARREPIPEELLERDFTAEPDWADAYAAQLDRALATWSDPAAWEGEIELGGMSVPAAEAVALILKEMTVHGWDVARATGQEFRLSDGAAGQVLATVTENAELYRRYDGFAEPKDAPEGSGPFTRALAESGRDPDWKS
ncbi:TIGR03086 family metal-binding protein [Actinomadura kijaniata]|uniref:TIGR03086 family metal-binding protein n=1 Tax=Actinomadura kijaniata TaxID=46161 RepID=UPI000831C178|nr:TIGR03086 family metal-binding protein [Actinomadura kijaniata]